MSGGVTHNVDVPGVVVNINAPAGLAPLEIERARTAVLVALLSVPRPSVRIQPLLAAGVCEDGREGRREGVRREL